MRVFPVQVPHCRAEIQAVVALDLRPLALTDPQTMSVIEVMDEKRPAHAVTAPYYPWFDWLRAVLAITVMLGHDQVIRWQSSGDLAVKVFFALSGWLIGGMLLQTPHEGLPRFFFNRAVRIWAPYYLALILLVGASLLREPVVSKWFEFVFYKLTFVYNLFGTNQLAANVDSMPLRGTGNHFWSVNAEEQFYLLAPLLLVLLPPRLGRSPLLWSVLAVMAWRLATAMNWSRRSSPSALSCCWRSRGHGASSERLPAACPIRCT
jgi:peptidoglycan/LPS O-acetylase OafA/YrhL